MNLTYEEKLAHELLDSLSKFGFNDVLRDFTRYNYEDWIRVLRSEAKIGYADEISDCYIFSDGDCDIYAASGASKVAFWTNDSDSVFKISFNKLKRDYCGLEAQYYNDAERLGLDEFFAATFFLMDYNNVRIYVAERAEVNFERLSSDLYEKLESDGMAEAEIRDTIEEAEECCEFINWLLPYYSDEDKVNALYEFLNESEINDLHSGNIGYIGNRLVLIDYSGYRG